MVTMLKGTMLIILLGYIGYTWKQNGGELLKP